MSHPALPPPVARPWIAVAGLAWVLAAVFGVPEQPEPLAAGHLEVDAVMITDVIAGRYGPYALAESDGTTLLLELDGETSDLVAGERVRVEGVASGRAGKARGVWHSSSVRVRRLERLAAPSGPHLVVGNAVRSRTMDRLQPFDDGRALLAGFLIGDTSEMNPADEDAMRLAGLSHFVAVSGSNVALFLGLLFVAAGPLALGPRRRALLGLIGLPVYAAATRFEPSVMRASVMAGIALAGKLIGLALEAWQLLSVAVIGLLATDPSLAGSVGFQLSVAATAGVLVGGRWPTSGGKAARALLVTMGAQIAVAPLLLFHFGTIPVFSPIANLAAAPLVSGATLLGAAGVAGLPFLIDLGSHLAEGVLALARGASIWPQAGPLQAAGLGLGLLAVSRLRWSRLPLALSAAAMVVVVALGGSGTLPTSGAVVLDIGQGDSILLHGGDGRFALVDGGPDPVALLGKLRSYGVTHLDLVVATHVHADHVTGLEAVVQEWTVAELWAAFEPHETGGSRALLQAAASVGVPVRSPHVGEIRQVGSLSIEVVGPVRRYKSPNDQSIVLMVRGPVRTILLAGDIEVIAQRDLPGLSADVLKVPHQGAATSNPEWLASVGADLAIISVGPNTFGHPVSWVIDVLRASGAEVHRTDLDGDVSVDLASGE